MDPNEFEETLTDFEQEAPASEPADEQPPVSSYHGAGAGRKESPYANSPYYSYQESNQENSGYIPNHAYNANYAPNYNAEPPKPKKPRKKLGKGVKRVLAAVLAIVLVAGACGITAWSVNERWEDETDKLEDRFEAQLASLQEELEQVSAAGTGISISGSPAAAEGLTPSQVYAMNVNSVVAVMNYATVASGWGGSAGYQPVGSGSGFILSEDGYVITNYHVVEGAEGLSVTTYLGEEYEATLVGSDKTNDVALLKVEATGLDPVEVGSSDDLIVGDMVVAIGNPLGELTATQTVGYISGKDRSVSTDGTIINMLQTDAAINSGNSGGPLFNMKGQVIGITTAKYSGDSGSGAAIEGIGFAIPIDDVISMIDDFKNYGYLKNQAYLGVEVMNTDAALASMYSLPSGSYVTKVVEGGSAHRAGVREKDIIIGLGGYTVDGNSTLTSVLRKFSAGDSTTITVFRAGQEITMDITFDERPQDLDAEVTEPTESQQNEMPSAGSYEDWYNYFFPFFGGENGNP